MAFFIFQFTVRYIEWRANRIQNVETILEDEGISNDNILNIDVNKYNISDITAKSYIVFDVENEDILLEKDSRRMYPVASLTKLLSALVIEDYMDMEEMIFIGPASINTFGNSAYLHLGERLSVKDLLHATLLVSSNDATEALARSFGRDEFIKTMKSISSNIGAYTTYWADPSGLGSSNISSAYDMAIILEHIYKNKRELLDITLKKSYSIRDHTWTNQTHFLSLSNYLGGKNGYTEEANRTTAGVFSIKDMVYSTSSAQYIENEVPIIVVVLGSENRDRDTLILLKEVGKIVKDRQ